MVKITGEENATGYGCTTYEVHGVTIRQEFAMVAMQGLLSNVYIISAHGSENAKWIAEHAVYQADSLIKALNETPNPNKESEVDND